MSKRWNAEAAELLVHLERTQLEVQALMSAQDASAAALNALKDEAREEVSTRSMQPAASGQPPVILIASQNAALPPCPQ